jgi:hypothetical protein
MTVPAPKTTCVECGASILEDTAVKTGGKCRPCANGTRAQIERAKVWAAENRERQRRNKQARDRIARIDHPTFADFLTEEDPFGVLWPFLVEAVYADKSRDDNVEGLTRPAKVVYLANCLDGEVFNGGLHQYFYNSSGKYAHETIFVLYELAALRRADLLQQAIHVFPSKRVPRDRVERDNVLDTLGYQAFDALDERYYLLGKTDEEDLLERFLVFMRKNASAHIK